MRHLVIAEDEELFRKERTDTMPWEDWGIILTGEADDGLDALGLLRERKTDLVITDVRMPGMDGVELMRAVSEEFKEDERPLFIVLSAHADFSYAREAMRLGAFDYLVKPVDDAELERVVRDALRRLDERDRRLSLERAARDDEALAFLRELSAIERTLGAGAGASGFYVEEALADIALRYAGDIGAESIASRLNISADHLSRLFKAATGITLGEYLTRYRVRRAMELLADPSVRIGEAADLCGYGDQRYFSTIFKKYTGMTPSEFRKSRLG